MDDPPVSELENDLALSGWCIASFESRMGQETRRLFERHGATVMAAPSLQEIPLTDQISAFEFGERLFASEVDVLVMLTGVGTRLLVDALSSRWERDVVLSKLQQLQLVCRGPKPVAALKALGLKPSFVVAEPNTWRDVVAAFDEHGFGQGKRVWVQEYGRPNPALLEALSKQSTSVRTVSLYGWKLPDDLEPLKAAIAALVAGTVRVAAFTSAIQVEHLFEVATQLGLDRALLQAMKERVVIASIGPLTTERLVGMSISVDIEPPHPKLGHMVQAIAADAKTAYNSKRATTSTS